MVTALIRQSKETRKAWWTVSRYREFSSMAIPTSIRTHGYLTLIDININGSVIEVMWCSFKTQIATSSVYILFPLFVQFRNYHLANQLSVKHQRQPFNALTKMVWMALLSLHPPRIPAPLRDCDGANRWEPFLRLAAITRVRHSSKLSAVSLVNSMDRIGLLRVQRFKTHTFVPSSVVIGGEQMDLYIRIVLWGIPRLYTPDCDKCSDYRR